jgi:hypothetical protein
MDMIDHLSFTFEYKLLIQIGGYLLTQFLFYLINCYFIGFGFSFFISSRSFEGRSLSG